MKTIRYKDFELELPTEPVSMSHSFVGDMIRGESSTRNMSWAGALGDLPWSKFKCTCPAEHEMASRLFSLMDMNYQVCNGGISQYYFNRYHESHTYENPDFLGRCDFQAQKQAFVDLVAFAKEIYPERKEENGKLSVACAAFGNLSYEKGVRFEDTIECDEDEYIIDDDTGEEIKNPDWFEAYEDVYYEDVIHGGEYFEGLFYDINEYMEELFEVYAQLVCKTMVRGLDEHPMLRDQLPASAFDTQWITVYKDTLGFPYNFDNLTAIKVPAKWLLPQITESGKSTEDWFAEYTADWTDDIARKALEEGVILDCTDPEIKTAISTRTPSLDSMIQDAKGRKADSSSHTNAPAQEQEH